MFLDNIDFTPITATYSAIEYVAKKQEKYPSVLSKEKQEKFDKMFKEDFFKDDSYKNMWDKDWINKK